MQVPEQESKEHGLSSETADSLESAQENDAQQHSQLRAQLHSQRGLLAAAAFVFLVLVYFFSAGEPEVPKRSLDEMFPPGASGLQDLDSTGDTARALKEKIEADILKSSKQVSPAQKAAEKEPEIAQVESIGPFGRVSLPFRRPVKIVSDNAQGVWVADRYGLAQMKNGETPQIKLDLSSYDHEFNDDMPPISDVHAFPSGSDVWLGFTNGQLMRYQGYEWKILSAPFEHIRQSVLAITEHNGTTYFGSLGLFQWDETFKRLLANPAFKKKRMYAFAKSKNNKLFALSRGVLWQFEPNTRDWKVFWKSLPEDRPLLTLAVDADENLFVGTKRGIVRLSEKAIVLERSLANDVIRHIELGEDDTLWVRTDARGLGYWDGEQWYVSGKEAALDSSLLSLHRDSVQQLWLGVDMQGVYKASEKAAIEWIRKFPDALVQMKAPEVFSNTCDAASSLLPEVAQSGGVSQSVFDGKHYVFFDGIQVCPRGRGVRRADGVTALLEGWTATVFKGTQRTQIQVPQEIPADQTKAMLIDSEENLWIGTEQGLAVYRGSEWHYFGPEEKLRPNPVSAIIEDARGNIWVGTRPAFDPKTQSEPFPNLHIYTNGTWAHFDPKNGLSDYSISDIKRTRDNHFVLGTASGLTIIDPTGKIKNIAPLHGMPSSRVNDVSIDKKNRVWIAHHVFGDGITWFDHESFSTFSAKEGLFSERIERIAHDRQGRVWLLSTNGQAGVYPKSYLELNRKVHPMKRQSTFSKNLFDPPASE